MKAQMDNPQKSLICVKDLSKTFIYHKKAEGLTGSLSALFHREKLKKEAVKQVSFEIQTGEFVGFIGENGAGKTTTLKMLSGILTPTNGQIFIDGHIPIQRTEEFKKKISLVMGQKSQLWLTLPALETFRLIQKMYEIPEKLYQKRLKELTDLMNVEDILHIQVRKLSLGQRMRCELMASLLHQPKILFLDEPTIGLDIVSQKNIRNFLKTYNQKEKTTIILTSHNMDDVEKLCQRLLIIKDGRIGYDGSLEKIYTNYHQIKYVTLEFSEKIHKQVLQPFGKVTKFSPFSAELKIASANAPCIIESIIKKLPLKDIGLKNVSLEEIVHDIFQKKNISP